MRTIVRLAVFIVSGICFAINCSRRHTTLEILPFRNTTHDDSLGIQTNKYTTATRLLPSFVLNYLKTQNVKKGIILCLYIFRSLYSRTCYLSLHMRLFRILFLPFGCIFLQGYRNDFFLFSRNGYISSKIAKRETT